MSDSEKRKPLAIDLFCGLGGWTDGLLAEGWDVVGFDIEEHAYGDARYPGRLVLQDVITIDGAQFSDADLIVASPPCQEFSYMAMPWRRAKQIARALRGEDEFPDGYRGSRTIPNLTALFDACFKIQREASAAAGRHIPMIVENVRGAQAWVGKAPYRYGSFFLWGDVPALMPMAFGGTKNAGAGTWFEGGAGNARDRVADAYKADGIKGFTPNGGPLGKNELGRRHGSKSKARKAASAMIAKIPLPLSQHIARTFKPQINIVMGDVK